MGLLRIGLKQAPIEIDALEALAWIPPGRPKYFKFVDGHKSKIRHHQSGPPWRHGRVKGYIHLLPLQES